MNRGRRRTRLISPNWTRKTNAILIIIFLVSVASATAFGLALGEWTRDGKARKMIDAANQILKTASITLFESQNIANEAARQKALASELETQLQSLKITNSNQTEEIQDVNVTATLALESDINTTIVEQRVQYQQTIDGLNLTLQQIRSVANGNQQTLLETGTCDLQGTSTVQIPYSFYKQTLEGTDFDLYYYVFGPSDFISFSSGSDFVKITNCNNPVLGGLPQTDLTLLENLDRFQTTPENWVGGVTSSGEELIIHRNTAVAGQDGQLKIVQPLNFWLQFF